MSLFQVDTSLAQQVDKKSGLEMLSLQEALASLDCMVEKPSLEELICTVQECRKAKNVAGAARLYMHIHNGGLETHSMLGNYVVSMLVECGSMSHAQQVFNRLVHRNEYCWTSLINGFVECGELEYALNLFQEMQDDCVYPSRFTLQALLKACARLQSVPRGQEIHTKIAEEGYESDTFVANTLVGMYANCGLFTEAWEVLEEMPARDVVSWNALIAGYADHGLGEKALNCLHMMQLEGFFPNATTLVCSLKSCCSVAAIGRGQELHDNIVKEGFERDTFVGNALVDLYAKCGMCLEAQEVFDELPNRSLVSWNVLILGYADQGLGEDALNCLERMQLERVSLDAVTFVCSLKACGSIGDVGKGQELHIEVAKGGFEGDTFVGNILVDMYAKGGLLAEAQEILKKLPVRDVISWNALITGYCEYSLNEDSLHCLEQMQSEGISSNAVTLACCLKACGSIGAPDRGQVIHSEIVEKGFERDSSIGNALMYMYINCGSLAEARKVFDELPIRNAFSWNAMLGSYVEHGHGKEVLDILEKMQKECLALDIATHVCSLKACGSIRAIGSGRRIHMEVVKMGIESDLFIGNTLVDMYAKCGSLTEALKLFNKMPVRDVVSWNVLIAGYCELRHSERALHCMEQMQAEGVFPNAVTFICCLRACGAEGAIGRAREIHAEITKDGFESEPFVGNTLVDLYVKCGSLAEAQEVFNELPLRDVVSWTALIAGYACQGESELVFRMFERMREEGLQPDRITFLVILSLCSHAGLVDRGQKYFESVSKEQGTVLSIEHHNCMIDVLGRAGQLDEAVAMVWTMNLLPNRITWSALLGACRKWGNLELGRHTFECSMRLNEKQDASFILMSNIYADAHMWEDARNINVMRAKLQSMDAAGRSCLKSGSGLSYITMVGDSKHVQMEHLDSSIKMKEKLLLPDIVLSDIFGNGNFLLCK